MHYDTEEEAKRRDLCCEIVNEIEKEIEWESGTRERKAFLGYILEKYTLVRIPRPNATKKRKLRNRQEI